MKLNTLLPWWGFILFAPLFAISLRELIQNRKKGKVYLYRWLRRLAISILLIVMSLGISVPGGSSAIGVSNLDVIFAVDVTPSMGAIDYSGAQQRIEGVRKDMLALTSKLKGARLEIITFDSSANLILPFTNDLTAFTTATQSLSPDPSVYSQGTITSKPADYIEKELQYSQKVDSHRQRLLFYLGDGEQTVTDRASSDFTALRPLINGGAVLGYGTAKGAKIVSYTGLGVTPAVGSSQYQLALDSSTKKLQEVISHSDSNQLKKIAEQLKVPSIDRNNDNNITDVYSRSGAKLAIDHSQHIRHYVNLYWLFAIPLVVLISIELQILLNVLLRIRSKKSRTSNHG